jgi:hypothetical protein
MKTNRGAQGFPKPLIRLDFRYKNLRGRETIGRQLPRPRILLKLEVKGKSRWPFGWEILRELGAHGNHLLNGSAL